VYEETGTPVATDPCAPSLAKRRKKERERKKKKKKRKRGRKKGWRKAPDSLTAPRALLEGIYPPAPLDYLMKFPSFLVFFTKARRNGRTGNIALFQLADFVLQTRLGTS
jgi:hypothetical protein